MTPGGIALLVASILGSTGLAGFLGSGARFTRAARLRSAIAATKESLDGLDPESSAYRATQASVTVMSLEVASYALVRVPMRRKLRVYLSALALLMLMINAFSLLPVLKFIFDTSSEMTREKFWLSDLDVIFNSSSTKYWFIYAIILLMYIILLITTLSMQTAMHREQFVAEALKRNEVDYELVTSHGRQLKKHVPESKGSKGKNAPKDENSVSDGPGTNFSQLRHFVPSDQALKKAMPNKRRAWWRSRAS